MKQPQFWFDFVPDWKAAPMAYWVHVEPDGCAWRNASTYVAPAPREVAHRGYPALNVAVDGFTFQFTSQAQLDACIEILSRVPLPTTRRLSQRRGSGAGPNRHWLSRLPAGVKAPGARAKAVAALKAVATALNSGNNAFESGRSDERQDFNPRPRRRAARRER